MVLSLPLSNNTLCVDLAHTQLIPGSSSSSEWTCKNVTTGRGEDVTLLKYFQ